MSNHIVEIDQLSQQIQKRNILDNISLTIEQGEIFGLLGPSGSGKTTLVKTIAGISRCTSGSVSVFNQQMPSKRVISQIGYMAQADALYEDMTALDNVNFFSELYGVHKKRKKERIEEVFTLVELTEHRKRFVHTFSGGMKRRLSLAIALLHEPALLILDEPTVGIDPLLRRSFWKEFQRLKESGVSILITTHVMDEAEHCDRLGFIRDGKCTASGSPHELKEAANAQTIEDAFLYFGGAPCESSPS
ncbi:ABC transporter ATP-binding protein [Bacillus taeanensis]|uniref:ABC transporter ATP-binding protein n=1 Tax=Bacillus taeanensis TaxID=273032 RepID=A0A366XW48_9BACI|nr:ABC transporter ATP-binding protein [Bacillus taeanensis]RBW68171.1 ABC transporter ATP-binding protein [Bacillus taeanensis]